MNTSEPQLDTSSFRLSLAILSREVQSPILFMHILVNPDNKKITGTCEMSGSSEQLSAFKFELTGAYRSAAVKDDQIIVRCFAFPVYDSNSPVIKITLVTDHIWKKGKAAYQYLKNENWVKPNKVYLKIKGMQYFPHPAPDLNVQQSICLSHLIV